MSKLSSYTRAVIIACFAVNAAVSSAVAQQSQPASPAASAEAGRRDPYEALRAAQTVFVRSKSVYFKSTALEQALLNREEFQEWDLVISRDETDADLIIEVSRKSFTNVFLYNVIDPRARRVLAGGKIGSLGGSVERQIADSFIKKLRRARAAAPQGKRE